MSTRPAPPVSLLVAALLAALTSGCASTTTPTTRVEQYGGMRAVLREGQSQARVALTDAAARPHSYAVGALAGLGGEVTILDGEAIVSRVEGGAPHTSLPRPGDMATLLTLSHVERWTPAVMNHAAAGATFEQAIGDIAAAAGVDSSRPFAFVVEGTATALELHIINGACPMAEGGEESGPHAPWRLHMTAPTPVTLVGFFAEGREGEMTHHGSRVHVHAILRHQGQRLTGHVESVAVAAGARVRVPDVR